MTVTRKQAEAALTAVKKRFKPWVDAGGPGPELRMDFDWFGHGPGPAIVWEEGPYQWATLDPEGDIDEEFGFPVPAIVLPDELWTEALTSCALGIYEKEAASA